MTVRELRVRMGAQELAAWAAEEELRDEDRRAAHAAAQREAQRAALVAEADAALQKHVARLRGEEGARGGGRGRRRGT